MHSIAWWPTCFTLAVATCTDLRSRRIPNWLVFPFLVAGIAVSGWLNGWQGIGMSLAGMALGAALFGLLAVEIAVTIHEQSYKTLIGGVFLIVALVFVYRSFYAMRIPEEDLAAEGAVKSAPAEKKTIEPWLTKTGSSGSLEAATMDITRKH